MADFSDGEFVEIMERVCADADRLEANAGYSGEHGDGGAEKMRSEVEMFRCGMNRRIPEKWLSYVQQMRTEQDPEWQEYLRLRDKFTPSF